jgi:hypothetical protein
MRHTPLRIMAAAGILFFGLSIGRAQYRDQDDWHHSRDSFYQGQGWRMRLFDRVREDLDHVQQSAFSGGDQYRIARTKEQLNELQSKLAHHRYDVQELNEAISGMERVIADNRLSSRDRDMLTDDLSRMRNYRDHHDDWR